MMQLETEEERDAIAYFMLGEWSLWARPDQLFPATEHRVILALAGRGWGKTRSGAEQVREWNKQGYQYVNLIGPTLDGELAMLRRCLSATGDEEEADRGASGLKEYRIQQYAGKAAGLSFLQEQLNGLNSELDNQADRFAGKAQGLGLVKPEDANVQQYVTRKALDGLYLMIAEEEKKIRADPVGTGSAILKKVFGF